MISFEGDAWEDYQFWQQNDQFILRKIDQSMKDIQRNPFDGVGKPEALRQNLFGLWSRRITHDHRLVSWVKQGDKGFEIATAQCRGHYE